MPAWWPRRPRGHGQAVLRAWAGEPDACRRLAFMSAEHARQDLHELVEHLPPTELRRILRLVIGELEAAEARMEHARTGSGALTPRRLSFVGIAEDEVDTAQRAEEILRGRFRAEA